MMPIAHGEVGSASRSQDRGDVVLQALKYKLGLAGITQHMTGG